MHVPDASFNDYLNIEDVKLGIVSRYQNVAVLRK